jgi:Fur family zinc uptake transcriptional regulator
MAARPKKTGDVRSGATKSRATAVSCQHVGETCCTRPSSEQVRNFLHQAEQLCAERKQRFTDLRKRVLELVCGYGQPVGAYALLDDLREEGRSAAPPTVYRALDFLQQQGLVHRLASNNTYLACAHPQTRHEGLFLVCSSCGHTQEVHTQSMLQTARRHAKDFDFLVEHAVVEVSGLCSQCQVKKHG